MNYIHLYLTTDEVNQALETLGQQPYVKVFDLIEKIKTQALPQLEHQENKNETHNPAEAAPAPNES